MLVATQAGNSSEQVMPQAMRQACLSSWLYRQKVGSGHVEHRTQVLIGVGVGGRPGWVCS